jgi:SPP1 family predicted phage head-tail adaptor
MTKAKSTVKDALGQYPLEDVPVCTVWVGVTPQTGSMLSGRQADTILTRTTHKVVMRYRDDIKPEMWIMIGGVRYDILYILDPYLRHETLEIFCEVKDYGRSTV